MTVNKLKIFLATVLITLGIWAEANVLYELHFNSGAFIENTSVTYQEPTRLAFRSRDKTYPLMAIHNYYHFLFGFNTIAGALLLASAKNPIK
jgi:hypothetical protein